MSPETILVHLRQSVRLDVYLTRRLPHVSRNRIQRHIERGDVLVDGATTRPSYKLNGGEHLTLKGFEERRIENASQPVDFDIVFEDEHLVVIDKPAGVLVHPVGKEYQSTLLNGLYVLLTERGEDASQIGVVHRLDRLTSGLLVMTKSLEARKRLGTQVEAHVMRRGYLGFVRGVPKLAQGSIDLWIRRDPKRPTRMQAVDAEEASTLRAKGSVSSLSRSGYSDPRRDLRPRQARTHYRVLRRFDAASLLALELETGRTHQIRVHLQAAGHALWGDPLYGPRSDRVPASLSFLRRPALHAASLCFVHPISGRPLEFRAKLPADLLKLAESLARHRHL